MELMTGKAPLVWIQGFNCTGCTCALMDSEDFDPTDLAFGKVSLRYQPDLMMATGDVATSQLRDIPDERPGRYVLVVEGAVPTGNAAHFCTFGLSGDDKQLGGNTVAGDVPIQDWLGELVPDAAAVVAVGNCASFGGFPAIIADVTGATPVADVVREIDAGKPVISIPGCPPHPDWLVGTLESAILWITGEADSPELDELGRVKEYYSSTVHELCERLPAFKEKRFIEDWNDIREDEDRCLLKLGCRGPKTRGDCPARLGHTRPNWCVSANSPCQGCTEPDFVKKLPHPAPGRKPG